MNKGKVPDGYYPRPPQKEEAIRQGELIGSLWCPWIQAKFCTTRHEKKTWLTVCLYLPLCLIDYIYKLNSAGQLTFSTYVMK